MIELKEKPCKGTGLAKGYGCGRKTKHRVYGIGKMCGCYAEWLLNSENGKLKMANAQLSAKSKVKKDQIRSTKEEKDNLKDWSAELQVKINWIVRMIDVGLLCLARGYGGQMQAGHVYARGGNSTMKFHLHNIHRQCAQSNHNQNDDGLLREGVVIEYGQPYMEYISNLRRMKTLDYSNREYHEFYKKACKIANRMNKENRYYSVEERIKKRNEINIELGIYDLQFCEFLF